MSYVKNQVRSLLTDTQSPDAWKLQELQRLLFRSERSRDDNQQAIETLEASIRRKSTPEKKEWLEANRNDLALHKAHIDLILDAIHQIRDRTIGTQLDLFSLQ